MSKYHKSEGGLWPNQEKAKSNHPDKLDRRADKRADQGADSYAQGGKDPQAEARGVGSEGSGHGTAISICYWRGLLRS